MRVFDALGPTPWFVVTTSRGLEAACVEEIEDLASDLGLRFLTSPTPMAAGVRLQADWETCVALNAGLTIASRVLLPLASGLVSTLEDVYAVASKVAWHELFDVSKTFAVGANVAPGSAIPNAHQVALKVKDALVDVFREACGARPDVNTDAPDIRIAVRVLGPELEISLNTSGEALTHHGYREDTTEAPLRESVAAGLLRYTGFASFARSLGSGEVHYFQRADEREGPRGNFPHDDEGPGAGAQPETKPRRIPPRIPWSPVVADPMCGSGTFLIEAALLLLNRRPCARREHFAFLELRMGAKLGVFLDRTQKRLMALERSVADVHAQAQGVFAKLEMEWEPGKPFLLGSDVDPQALASAKMNAAAAGVSKLVSFERRDATRSAAPASHGLCIVNPPYGERLGGKETLPELYKALGDQWKREYTGWMCWLLSGNAEAAKAVGLRPTRKKPVFNGNLPCSFQQYVIY
jgi:putative N6-adenine-specific DNA methylase